MTETLKKSKKMRRNYHQNFKNEFKQSNRSLTVMKEYLNDTFHDDCFFEEDETIHHRKMNWRLQNKIKTGGVLMFICLNFGKDPPGIVKVSPCSVTECGVDHRKLSKEKAIDQIANNLQEQYHRFLY